MRTSDAVPQKTFGFPDYDLKTPLHDEMMLWVARNAEMVAKLESNDEVASVVRVRWEQPLLSGPVIRGYLDLLIDFEVAAVDLSKAPPETYRRQCKLGIEVKAVVSSIGDLIRQLTTYQTLFRQFEPGYGRKQLAVLTPSPSDDLRYVCSSQGFSVFDYDKLKQ